MVVCGLRLIMKQKKKNSFPGFSVYQVEYSRNFLFRRGRQLDKVSTIINFTREE